MTWCKKKKKTLRVLLRSPTALPPVDDDDANPSSLGFEDSQNILEGPTGNRKAKTLSERPSGSEDETILCDIYSLVGYVGDKLNEEFNPTITEPSQHGLGRVQYKTDDFPRPVDLRLRLGGCSASSRRTSSAGRNR